MQVRNAMGAVFFVVAASLVLHASAEKNPPGDPAKIQKTRTAFMKGINRRIRKALVFIKKNDFQNLAAAARELSARLGRIPELSPKGSAFGKTRIKPEVWENFDHYRKLSTEAAAAAARLAKVAETGDRKSAKLAFRGLARACTNCHKPYRKKKRPKG